MNIGVVSIQGDVSEHIDALSKAADSPASVNVSGVRTVNDLGRVDGLVIPGGESTTISRLLQRWGLHDGIITRAKDGFPIMGTCAGCILMASRGKHWIDEKGVRLLKLVDMEVDRNAYGRQTDSFEATGHLNGHRVPLVFIRAPIITDVGNCVEVILEFDSRPVMVRQGNCLALTYHPELSNDTTVHRMFLDMVKGTISDR